MPGANWDVEEMIERLEEIASSNVLRIKLER
jgi:hypothetical protein